MCGCTYGSQLAGVAAGSFSLPLGVVQSSPFAGAGTANVATAAIAWTNRDMLTGVCCEW